ncbi:2Fe-2S iron-sulfur cluster binding domain-containing protein [Niallia oryzisoli]|uniref:2Fe-2S iron-sulfur cluster binding domain-containing protein n=1 Tax=Niallia oryzisoli TaxID=1737571 RepID=A0ABZ2CJ14_9BACI
MKKLTIGSLKYGSIKSNVSVDQPAFVERLKANETNTTVKETGKIVDIKQNQQSFQVKVKKGQSILDAALEQNFPLEYSCKKGTCGKCKVNVVNGDTYLQPTNSQEEKKLQDLIKRGFRLACQAIAR